MSQPLSGHLGRKIGLDRDEDTTLDRRGYTVGKGVAPDFPVRTEGSETPVRDILALVLLVVGGIATTVGVGLSWGWPEAMIVAGLLAMVVGTLLALL